MTMRELQNKLKKHYDDVKNYQHGLAAVNFNEKWGFIDTTGKEVIEVKYDYVGDFCEGFALVKLNGKWGCVDQTGNVVISFEYDGVKPDWQDEDRHVLIRDGKEYRILVSMNDTGEATYAVKKIRLAP